MNAEMEVKVLWGDLMEANPDQRDKGAGKGRGREAAREGASGGSLRCSAEPSESEALMRRTDPEGELAASSESKSIGMGRGVKATALARSSAYLPGETSRLPPIVAVVIEDERTR
jgi:hypothetical protein